MIHSPKPDNPDVAAIKGFEHRIEKCYLRKEGRVWYADTIGHAYPDELTAPEQYTEGARKVITVNAYERSAEARKTCFRHHGTVCKGCGFNFEKPTETRARTSSTSLKTIAVSYKIDPVADLVLLCPNGHATVHRSNESRPLSVEALRSIINEAKKRTGATG